MKKSGPAKPLALSVAILLSCLFLALAQKASAVPTAKIKDKDKVSDTAESATVLEQQGTVCGKQTIYITPNAVRIDNKQRNLITVCSAPDWNISIYSPTAKRYCVVALSKYRGSLSQVFLFYGIDMSAFDFKLIRKATLQEHECLVYQPIPKKGSTDDDDKRMSSACRSFWVAEKLDVSKEGADLIAKQVCLPQTHKVPLRMDYLSDGKTTMHALETTKWLKTSVQRKWFLVPQGYKQVALESQLYMGIGKSDF